MIGRHSILQRQLKHYHLTEDACPQNLEQWQKFLERVNQAYLSFDQDRYLSERSQEVSNREMLELNKTLQEAQSIAHMGSWTLEIGSGKMQLSNEAYLIGGLDPSLSPPSYPDILEIFQEGDREVLKRLYQTVIETRKRQETEVKTQIKDDSYRWLQITAKPVIYGIDDTHEKIKKVTGTVLDITERKLAQEREAELNHQVVIAARETGMAEIATSVLHNVGNVLNSINVSATLIAEKLEDSKMGNLEKIAQLLQENETCLADFFTNDPKGQRLPGYLIKLSDYWEHEQQWLSRELRLLTDNVEHIKSIVRMQQSISGVAGIIESHVPVDILEEALQIDGDSLKKADITLIREYHTKEKIMVDKSKLHQILLNLIHNARDALLPSNGCLQEDKKIVVRVSENEDKIQIQVEDNGIGIPPENLDKIFSFGFSSKKTGHGFGLHASALSAKEMGGSLRAKSAGLYKGAIFTLELPKQKLKQDL